MLALPGFESVYPPRDEPAPDGIPPQRRRAHMSHDIKHGAFWGQMSVGANSGYIPTVVAFGSYS